MMNVFVRGVGWGGVINLRCWLANKDDVLRWMMIANKDYVLRWMMMMRMDAIDDVGKT